jgi:hypothetical protein
MKLIWLGAALFLAAMAAVLLLPRPSGGTAALTAPSRSAVVVELFTSEGCSSCPPADNLLAQLRHERPVEGVEVITLGLHVDYWNSQGWTDRFSSSAYTQRQQDYVKKLHLQDAYTPQMVVDGASEFVGNDSQRARQAIIQAASRPQHADVDIGITSLGAVQLLEVKAKGAAGTTGEVMLAFTEDNLVTKVQSGENGGRELHHSAVVRELRSLGHMRNGSFQAKTQLVLNKEWKRNDLRVVVFVQEPGSGQIAGAASLHLAGE